MDSTRNNHKIMDSMMKSKKRGSILIMVATGRRSSTTIVSSR
jgi:hypothetical protein